MSSNNSNTNQSNSNNLNNFVSNFGLYSEGGDELVRSILDQAMREGWRWPQVYYYILDELKDRFPEIEDSSAREAIYFAFQRMGGDVTENHLRHLNLWRSGNYRDYMTEPLNVNNNTNNNSNNNNGPTVEETYASLNHVLSLLEGRRARGQNVAEEMTSLQQIRRLLQELNPQPQAEESLNESNYSRTLQGLYHDPLPRNAANAIMGNNIQEGNNMVNFHGEANLGRYYKRSTYNAMPAPKKNPYTRRNIKASNVVPYKASLKGGKRTRRAKKVRKTLRKSRA